MKGFLGMIWRIQLRCIVCFQIYGILEYCKYYSNEVRREKKQVSLYIMGRKLKTILCSYSVEERKLLSYVTQKESHGFPHALRCPQESHTSQKMWILFPTAGKLNHQQWSKCIVYIHIHGIPNMSYFNVDKYTEDKSFDGAGLLRRAQMSFIDEILVQVSCEKCISISFHFRLCFQGFF